ncbi:MAG TPA: hypothetical protein DDX71_03810 [Ruminococcus sp.]|nr:hypothetical protein [Ruminococcus sp.]
MQRFAAAFLICFQKCCGVFIDSPDIPVLAKCDFSHCAPMLTIPIGMTAELDADAQTIRMVQ